MVGEGELAALFQGVEIAGASARLPSSLAAFCGLLTAAEAGRSDLENRQTRPAGGSGRRVRPTFDVSRF